MLKINITKFYIRILAIYNLENICDQNRSMLELLPLKLYISGVVTYFFYLHKNQLPRLKKKYPNLIFNKSNSKSQKNSQLSPHIDSSPSLLNQDKNPKPHVNQLKYQIETNKINNINTNINHINQKHLFKESIDLNNSKSNDANTSQEENLLDGLEEVNQNHDPNKNNYSSNKLASEKNNLFIDNNTNLNIVNIDNGSKTNENNVSIQSNNLLFDSSSKEENSKELSLEYSDSLDNDEHNNSSNKKSLSLKDVNEMLDLCTQLNVENGELKVENGTLKKSIKTLEENIKTLEENNESLMVLNKKFLAEKARANEQNRKNFMLRFNQKQKHTFINKDADSGSSKKKNTLKKYIYDLNDWRKSEHVVTNNELKQDEIELNQLQRRKESAIYLNKKKQKSNQLNDSLVKSNYEEKNSQKYSAPITKEEVKDELSNSSNTESQVEEKNALLKYVPHDKSNQDNLNQSNSSEFPFCTGSKYENKNNVSSQSNDSENSEKKLLEFLEYIENNTEANKENNSLLRPNYNQNNSSNEASKEEDNNSQFSKYLRQNNNIDNDSVEYSNDNQKSDQQNLSKSNSLLFHNGDSEDEANNNVNNKNIVLYSEEKSFVLGSDSKDSENYNSTQNIIPSNNNSSNAEEKNLLENLLQNVITDKNNKPNSGNQNKYINSNKKDTKKSEITSNQDNTKFKKNDNNTISNLNQSQKITTSNTQSISEKKDSTAKSKITSNTNIEPIKNQKKTQTKKEPGEQVPFYINDKDNTNIEPIKNQKKTQTKKDYVEPIPFYVNDKDQDLFIITLDDQTKLRIINLPTKKGADKNNISQYSDSNETNIYFNTLATLKIDSVETYIRKPLKILEIAHLSDPKDRKNYRDVSEDRKQLLNTYNKIQLQLNTIKNIIYKNNNTIKTNITTQDLEEILIFKKNITNLLNTYITQYNNIILKEFTS